MWHKTFMSKTLAPQAESSPLSTECTQSSFTFAKHFRRQVSARFDGGVISSDGGALLLREVDQRINLLPRLAACFEDGRDSRRIEHRVEELVSQRVYGLALGYEDLNDHDELRSDPLLALLAGKSDVGGQQRRRERDRGQPLAGKSTLNRLERTTDGEDRYQKIRCDSEAIDRLLVEVFLEAHPQEPAEILLDVDATDTPLHGQQEGRFFHGYYGHYCYLPLYILQRRARVVRAAAGVESGCSGGQRGGVGEDRGADPGRVAEGEDHPAWGLGVLSGRVAELVRREPGGVCGGAGAQRAAAVVDRAGAPKRRRAGSSRRAGRRGSIASSSIGRLRVGAGSGGWWRKPNSWWASRIRATW